MFREAIKLATERIRNDRGRYMSQEEIKAAELEKQDAQMNKWFIQRLNNSSAKRLGRRIFGTPQEDMK